MEGVVETEHQQPGGRGIEGSVLDRLFILLEPVNFLQNHFGCLGYVAQKDLVLAGYNAEDLVFLSSRHIGCGS